MKTIGAVTIGQSPRVDLARDFMRLSEGGVKVVEAGALDDMSAVEVARCAPETGDYVLVSRMRDGSQARLSRDKLLAPLRRRIDGLFAAGIPVVLLLCSCEFPELLAAGGLLIQPSGLLFGVVSALAGNMRLAALMPTPEQVGPAREKWEAVAEKALVFSASPYVSPESEIDAAAQRICEWGADLCVMDCAGYPRWMKERLQRRTNAPTVSALGVAMSVCAELLE